MPRDDAAGELFEAAKAAAGRAHAPYSKLSVGVALRSASGTVHAGCNVENAAFPEGWCAETTAIGHMVMAGESAIAEACVFSPEMARITPCGGCRQRLKEFGTADTRVHLCDADGIVETIALGDLLPAAFEM